MRKIIVTSFLTMDGVLQAPGGPEEDPTGGFKWGGWSAYYGDEATGDVIMKIMSQPFDLLLGRFTYDIFAAHWPYIKDNPIADKFNKIKKFVVSGNSSLELSWAGSTLITGDVVNGLQELKQQEGPDLLVHGSGRLVQTLLANGLADTLHIWTYPVTTGSGKRLFAEGTPASGWKLQEVKTSSTGVIMATYEPSGDIKTGTVGGELREIPEAEKERRKKIASL